MMTKNKTVLEKCKIASRNAFINIGNSAVGNTGDIKKGIIPMEPFSHSFLWPYEKKAPRRKV